MSEYSMDSKQNKNNRNLLLDRMRRRIVKIGTNTNSSHLKFQMKMQCDEPSNKKKFENCIRQSTSTHIQFRQYYSIVEIYFHFLIRSIRSIRAFVGSNKQKCIISSN